jgi:hypothetical protein
MAHCIMRSMLGVVREVSDEWPVVAGAGVAWDVLPQDSTRQGGFGRVLAQCLLTNIMSLRLPVLPIF